MPKEHRRIVFTHEELRSALENHAGLSNGGVPEGEIITISTFRKDNEYLAELNILDFDSKESRFFQLPEKELETALVEHCVNGKTPLPRDTEKVLRILDNTACLDLFVGEVGKASGTGSVLREVLAKQEEILGEVRDLAERVREAVEDPK